MDKTFKKWQNDSVWWSTTCSNIILLTNLLCLWWTHMFAIYSIKTAKTKIQETKTQSTSTITDGGQVKLSRKNNTWRGDTYCLKLFSA